MVTSGDDNSTACDLETVGDPLYDHNYVDPLSMVDAEMIDDPVVDIR